MTFCMKSDKIGTVLPERGWAVPCCYRGDWGYHGNSNETGLLDRPAADGL